MKLTFANTLAELGLGITAASIMTDCERYGMSYGCDEDCPQLQRGECEIYNDVDDYFEQECNNK
ncbi:hypothetical protein AAAU98_14675 [Enterocloster citroniae]|uniref:hypothetical protein n=1 Tax=Enterocloster citroniae TaxID=358743 RepID=UPI0032C13EB4